MEKLKQELKLAIHALVTENNKLDAENSKVLTKLDVHAHFERFRRVLQLASEPVATRAWRI